MSQVITVEKSLMTRMTLTNACQLVSDIVEQIAGEEISSHISGEAMYGSALHQTVMVKLRSGLAQHISL